MDVSFRSEKLSRLCNSEKPLTRKYGKAAADKVGGRLQDLLSQECLEDMRYLSGHCHELKGNRAGQIALEVSGSLRLIFIPTSNPPPTKPDGGLDWKHVKSVIVLEIEEYH